MSSSVGDGLTTGAENKVFSQQMTVAQIDDLTLTPDVQAVKTWRRGSTSERYLKVYMESDNPFRLHEVIISFKAKSKSSA